MDHSHLVYCLGKYLSHIYASCYNHTFSDFLRFLFRLIIMNTAMVRIQYISFRCLANELRINGEMYVICFAHI